MSKRFLFIVLMVLFLPIYVFSQSITIIMIQNDKTVDEIKDITIKMESAIMDSFFDYGYVITNEPAIVADNENANLTSSLSSAFSGKVSYVVPITVNFKHDIKSGEELLLKSIESVNWEIISVEKDIPSATGKSVVEKLKISSTPKEAEKAIVRFSERIAYDISNTVKKL